MSNFRPAPVLLAFMVGGLFGAGRSVAEDRRIQIPSGWKTFGAPVRVCPTGGVALALEAVGSNAYDSYSQLMFIEKGGDTSFTDIPGKITWIECDPTGDDVLVNHLGPDGEKGTLVSEPSGEIVWTKNTDGFLFHFSPTGKFIYAENSKENDWEERGAHASNKIKLYNLDGKPRGVITLKEVPEDFRFVNDTTAFVRAWRSLTLYRVSRSRLVRLWSHPIDPNSSNMHGVSVWSPGRDLIIFEENWRTKIFGLDGKILYDFDNTTALPVGNSASYDLRPWTEGQLLFYNRTPDAFVLDVATGVLKSKHLDIAPPPGFKLEQFEHFTAVFVSDDEVIVRTIAP